jgi:regulatory protein
MAVIFTVTEALDKMKKFCAYQERSQQEVRQKLYLSSFKGEVAEFVIAELIKENFLNEERFARSFARGKFRIKQWSKLRIKLELQQKGISDACIRKGLTEIPDSEYEHVVLGILKKLSKESLPKTQKEKWQLMSKLRAKGFETDVIEMVWKQILNEETN